MRADICCHSLNLRADDLVNVALFPSPSNHPHQREYQQ